MKMRTGLASMMAIAVATLAAQARAETNDAAADQPAAAPQAVSADAPAAGGGGDIVVTAQRRSEQLGDVPATINVTSADSLASANITNSLEFGQLVPAVQVVSLGSYSQPAIRGVTTQVVGVGNPANVALYIDGIYITAQDAYNFDFLGIERIETLKGPQGTLYGRNATGGAILVTTKKPSFDWGGNATVSYGNLDTRLAKGYLTGPITDDIAFNVSAMYKADDGYYTNITTGNDKAGKNRTFAVRGKVLIKPGDNAEIQIGADYSYFNNPIGWLPQPYKGNSVAVGVPGYTIATKPYETSLTFDPTYHNKQGGAFIRGDFDLGGVDLVSLSSYRKITSVADSDTDYSPLPTNRNIRYASEESMSQEFNLSSQSDGPLSWIVGAMAASEDSRNNPVIANGSVNVRNKVKSTAYSAFGELTYAITPQLEGVVGARYSYERKQLRGTFGAPNKAPVAGRKKWQALTPRIALRYSPNPDVNIYASYNKGFKSGGYNTNNSNSTNSLGEVVPFDQEKIDSYEVGTKLRLSSFASLDLSAYYSNYKDSQVAASITTAGISATQVLNAASARIYGVEGELRLRPAPGLTAQIGMAYTHDRYTDFPNALITAPKPAGNGNTQAPGDASGNRLIRIPDFTASIAAQYERDIGPGKIYLSGNAFFSSGFYGDFGNRLKQPSYQVFNAQIGFGPSSESFKISAFAKNIGDQKYALVLRDAGLSGDVTLLAPPRTYGVIVDVNF
ncbi:TonB-dependent receptor [Novosphingobium album (ex Liu et al. 2023)]|uniref:TonB-dependent receptor n=1 Tax=Novosphingobium album (ex Liu et al. 2023) TaxID=3031130 RepID=A0ABT5WXC4_9SPHN|nr:TonB-dependent receptor [Novosphingobium album (ex Liu et al. 2023)]MDE8654501.1 TonB-dependent receptor [Novosphingobium album (ex Liu et al. 2023)]